MNSDNNNALLANLLAENIAAVSDESLAAHTTFHVGGPAHVFCEPKNTAELVRALELCRKCNTRVYLLGNGSNTLFADKGFDGAVVSLAKLASRTTFQAEGESVLLCTGAGAMLSSVCLEAQKHALTGLEFAYGIPGTVGGAVYMNAGAYGGEMKDRLVCVSYLDEDLKLRTKAVDELELGYRTSIFEKKGWCIIEAVFRLEHGNKADILEKMKELMQRRRDKQPLDMPSAGSTFKRPEGAFAGKLIEDCDLRGFTVGGAQISTKHCGFVVNCGGATCADVVALTQQVKKIVWQKTGVVLECEIRVVE